METSTRYRHDPQAAAVAAFMIKIGAPVLQPLVSKKLPFIGHTHFLFKLGEMLAYESNQLATLFKESGREDERLMRAHLILEEVGELLEALGDQDEALLTDAIADTVYVLAGTAITYDLPYQAAFDEVHHSNMSKDCHVQHDAGIKGKGINYTPPEVKRVIERHRHEA